ncbi:MAG: hypothetical protein CVT95_03065, partial [Bacteroidetes bacterium HGW-Bacteroidetes-12]
YTNFRRFVSQIYQQLTYFLLGVMLLPREIPEKSWRAGEAVAFKFTQKQPPLAVNKLRKFV